MAARCLPGRCGTCMFILTVEVSGTVPPGEVCNKHVLTVKDGGTVTPEEVWNINDLTAEDGGTSPPGTCMS